MEKNIFGLTSIFAGRLGSFTGKESVIGNFFFGFSLIFLTFFYKNIKNKSQYFNCHRTDNNFIYNW